MQFILWQNIISPHQGSFIRALAGKGHGVTVVAPEEMSPDLLAAGWHPGDMGNAEIILAPSATEIRQIVEGSPEEAIHVLAGARWTPLGNEATRWCRTLRRRMGVLTEAPDPRGVRGLARRAKYTIERYTQGRDYEFILAMGELGVRWFGQCGYPSARLFPFAYVTTPVDHNPVQGLSGDGSEFGVLAVAQLIQRKGVDTLLRAFSQVRPARARLPIVGRGAEEGELRALAAGLGISDQVEWRGSMDNSEIPTLMAAVDLLVLPSRHDGWGAVVNEALMVGTPVICSTACGAAELLREPWLGAVFKAGSVEGLATVLGHWTAAGPRTPAERQRIREWSRCISGDRVADYFLAIMEHVFNDAPRPNAPWRK